MNSSRRSLPMNGQKMSGKIINGQEPLLNAYIDSFIISFQGDESDSDSDETMSESEL